MFDVMRLRVGCSTTRIPHLIARPIALTTALTTPTTMSVCGPGCSGPSASGVNGKLITQCYSVWLACKDKVP